MNRATTFTYFAVRDWEGLEEKRTFSALVAGFAVPPFPAFLVHSEFIWAITKSPFSSFKIFAEEYWGLKDSLWLPLDEERAEDRSDLSS